MSADPGIVYLRDSAGNPVGINTHDFPEFMRPDLWFDNAYWRHSQMLSESEVAAYLAFALRRSKDPLSLFTIRRFALYIETWAKHMAMAAWIFLPPEKREGYANSMRPFLEELVTKRRAAKSMVDLETMISLSVDRGFDPL